MSRYLRENALEDKIAKSEKDLAQVKDKWYKLNRMNPTASQKAEMDKLKKQMGDLVTQIKRDKRELKTGSPGYGKPSKEPKSVKPDFLDLDGDGNEEESMKDAAKQAKNESYTVIKLKDILFEGFAWERKADGSLPTLADTTAAYQAKLREEAELNMPYGDEDVEDDDIDNDTDSEIDESAKTESYSLEWLKNGAAKLTKNDALKNASPAEVIKSLKDFKQNQNSTITKIEIDQLIDGIKSKERWWDSDGDGKGYEPGEDVNESYLITKGGEQLLREIPLEDRIRKNFIGNK